MKNRHWGSTIICELVLRFLPIRVNAGSLNQTTALLPFCKHQPIADCALYFFFSTPVASFFATCFGWSCSFFPVIQSIAHHTHQFAEYFSRFFLLEQSAMEFFVPAFAFIQLYSLQKHQPAFCMNFLTPLETPNSCNPFCGKNMIDTCHKCTGVRYRSNIHNRLEVSLSWELALQKRTNYGFR